jgi:disulfide bond formation protein DsbB
MNRQVALFLAWIIAVIALVVTLYSSIVKLLPICHLCWYQRICLYPLVIILGIGGFVDDVRSAVYALPLALISCILALYQYILQWYPQFESIGVCGLGPKCSAVHFKYLGFITYPFLSLIASIVISILLIIALKARGADA